LNRPQVAGFDSPDDTSRDEHFLRISRGGATSFHYGSLENGCAFAKTLRVGLNQPAAYVLEDPLFAIGFLRGLLTRGLRVPDDISFVTASCGKLGRYLPVSLTTVYPDLDELAEKIVELLLGRVRGELSSERQCIWLKPRLVVGESTVRATGGC